MLTIFCKHSFYSYPNNVETQNGCNASKYLQNGGTFHFLFFTWLEENRKGAKLHAIEKAKDWLFQCPNVWSPFISTMWKMWVLEFSTLWV